MGREIVRLIQFFVYNWNYSHIAFEVLTIESNRLIQKSDSVWSRGRFKIYVSRSGFSRSFLEFFDVRFEFLISRYWL